MILLSINTFVIEQDVPLLPEVLPFIGVKRAVILAGTYQFNPFASKYGTVLDVNMDIQ